MSIPRILIIWLEAADSKSPFLITTSTWSQRSLLLALAPPQSLAIQREEEDIESHPPLTSSLTRTQKKRVNCAEWRNQSGRRSIEVAGAVPFTHQFSTSSIPPLKQPLYPLLWIDPWLDVFQNIIFPIFYSSQVLAMYSLSCTNKNWHLYLLTH